MGTGGAGGAGGGQPDEFVVSAMERERHHRHGSQTCPSGHGLREFRTPNGSFGCDLCGHPGQFPRGTTMWGCRECNHDVCRACRQRACRQRLFVM